MPQQPQLEAFDSYAQNVVDTVREPLLMLDTTLRVCSANRAFYQTFRVSPQETENRLIYELGNGQWDITALRTLLEEIIPQRSVFDDFELEHDFPVIGRKIMLLNARQLKAGDHGELIVLAMEDVTEQRRAQQVLQEIDDRFRAIVAATSQIIWTRDTQGDFVAEQPSWSAFTGQTFAQIQGQGWRDAIHPDDREGVAAAWQNAVQSGSQYEVEYRLRRADGEYRDTIVRAAPVFEKGGIIREWVGTNTDTTESKQAEVELRESETRKTAIVETALDCIIAIDGNSLVTEFNPAAEKTFGYARAEAIGRSLPELIIPPALREAHRRGLQHYLKTGEGPVLAQRIEVPAMRADGSEILVELAITRVPIEGLPHFTAYLRDITERKQAEADLATHASLATLGADIGIALVQGDTLPDILQRCAAAMVQHLDAAFARIWTLNEIENVLELQASAGLYTHLDGPHSRVPVGKFKIGLIAQERAPHLTNQVVGDERVGDQEWAQREGMTAFAGYPLIVGDHLVGVMALFSRHELAERTFVSLASIADSVALGIKRKRTEAELEKAKESAEAATKTKSLFLANMSHELRTPLNAILGYSEMLQEEAVEEGVEAFVPDLKKIHGAGQHLLALINDILDISKIEAGKMEMHHETFAISKLVEEIVGTMRPLVQANSNTLRVQLPDDLGFMHSDLLKIRQSLLNLMSNAAKFTKNGDIALEVSREEMEGREWIWFRVTDTGIGMSAEQIVKLFQTFTQADASTTRKFGGTGLGLALTRRFCQMMGGDVTVHSVPGEGSTFTIKVPANEESLTTIDAASLVIEAVADENEAAAPPEGSSVLVIDDDVTQRDLMRRFLTRAGFTVRTASSGDEGLRLARLLRPMAITLDVMMPGLDGWSVLSSLKADAVLRDIPVIMVTMVDDEERGYALGAADYATKPVDRARLAQILEKYRCSSPPCPVLLVEDDAVTREMMRAMLEKDGWIVSEAANGRDALQRLAENRPTLILLDLMMPEMDGFEFAAEVHRHPEWRSIPIVVLTAKDLTEADRLRLNGYVQKVLSKGACSRDELLHQVRDLIAGCEV